jgi:hypothetical protein
MTKPLRATQHCRHYSYSGSILTDGGGPKCARGMNLSAPGSASTCMPDTANVTPCPSREEYTENERAGWTDWMAERACRSVLILAEIPGSSRDKKNRPGWGQSGAFPCPACDWGEVRWQRARLNGHLRAVCTTKDCFGVIE